jgi:hopanoid biosynthesis associated RND transporter like protein HpnN
MTAERKPQAEASYLVVPIQFLTRVAVRYPWPTLALAVALALAALAYSAAALHFHTKRLDLLNPESPYNKRWLQYIRSFGDDDDLVVVVEGSREKMVRAMDDVAAHLARNNHLFGSVLHRVDLAGIRAKGMYYLSVEDLAAIDRFLDQLQPVLHGDWSQVNLGHMLALAARSWAEPAGSGGDASISPHAFFESFQAALRDPERFQSPWPRMPAAHASLEDESPRYTLTDNGRFGFVLLRLTDDVETQGETQAAIDQLRQILVGLGTSHPGVRMGLTGLPVMENDEMLGSRSDTTRSSVLSLLGVACVFFAGFGGLRHPLLSVLVLAVAECWSLGFTTLVIGHLNILSMAFGAILIGLGTDFSIYYLARYVELVRTSLPTADSLEQTAVSVGPGIVTGGLTTALAFFAAGLTDFRGVAELGIISGGGVVLCLLATLTVLPALIHLCDRHRPHPRAQQALNLSPCLAPFLWAPRSTVALSLAGLAILAAGLSGLAYDHNLLNLQPVGVESVALEHRLLAESDQSLWYALSLADSPQEVLGRKEQFLRLATVERTEEIASLLPVDVESKQRIIERTHERLARLPDQPPQIPIESPAVLGAALGQLNELAAQLPPRDAVREQLAETQQLIASMTSSECYRSLATYQQNLARDLLHRLHILRVISTPHPPELADLPKSMVSRFVGRDGRYLLKIYGRGNIWQMEDLAAFVRDVRSVDPEATGNPLQTYEASLQMQQSYLQATCYSLIAVTILLLIDFRSARMTLLALLPVVFGTWALLGLVGALGIPLNPANMIVLPLILGIGIDGGVHVVHDFRSQSGRFRLTGSTTTAVVMTALTNMVGFGSLMTASHRGLVSLGRMVTLGVGCCLVMSLVTLPAMLRWISERREAKLANRLPLRITPHRYATPSDVPARESSPAPAKMVG